MFGKRTKEYEVRDFNVTVAFDTDGEWSIQKIELYSYETTEFFDITSQRSDKVDSFLNEKLNEIIAEEESEEVIIDPKDEG